MQTKKEECMTQNLFAEVYTGSLPKVADHILLICNGAGKIVFASGDAKIFCCKIHHLRNQDLFELGFTQHSLEVMKEQQLKGNFFRPKNRQKFHLEMVNSNEEMTETEQEFNNKKNIYLKKITLNCSFMTAKFGPYPVQTEESNIKKPTSLLRRQNQRQLKDETFTLVEAFLQHNQPEFFSNFADYTSTMNRLPQFKKVYRKIVL